VQSKSKNNSFDSDAVSLFSWYVFIHPLDVDHSEAGLYKVTTTNDLSKATTEGSLLVKAPPKIRKKMQDMALECQDHLDFCPPGFRPTWISAHLDFGPPGFRPTWSSANLEFGPPGFRPTRSSAHLDFGPLGSYKSQEKRERQLAMPKRQLV
jgi:hypothetical protein